MKPPRRRLSRARRRAVLLEAGLEVFARFGYDAASIEAIAERAGVSKPVLYDHFGSKRELYTAVLAGQVNLLKGEVLSAAGQDQGAIEQRIRNSALAALRFAREHPRSWRLLFQEPAGDEEIAKAFGELRDAAAVAVAAEITASGFRPPEGIDGGLAARAVAGMLMAAVESLGDQAVANPSVEIEVLCGLYVDLVWPAARRATA